MADKYLYIREFEDEVTRMTSNDLEEFKDFCHYASLSDWGKHKEFIERCLREGDTYSFIGNDVHYFIRRMI